MSTCIISMPITCRYVLTLGFNGVHPLCPRERLRKAWAAPEINIAQWRAFRPTSMRA